MLSTCLAMAACFARNVEGASLQQDLLRRVPCILLATFGVVINPHGCEDVCVHTLCPEEVEVARFAGRVQGRSPLLHLVLQAGAAESLLEYPRLRLQRQYQVGIAAWTRRASAPPWPRSVDLEDLEAARSGGGTMCRVDGVHVLSALPSDVGI